MYNQDHERPPTQTEVTYAAEASPMPAAQPSLTRLPATTASRARMSRLLPSKLRPPTPPPPPPPPPPPEGSAHLNPVPESL